MNTKARITSEVVRVRGHFLIKLADWQWALAMHAIAAGEAADDEKIRVHLEAVVSDLSFINESAGLLGFSKIAEDARQTARMISLFLERCIDTPNKHKLLTDVILEINRFVANCKRLSEQPTVLQNIDLAAIAETLGAPIQT